MVYAGVDYNLTLCPLQSRLQHTYHGQLYARSTLTQCLSRFILHLWTLDLASGLRETLSQYVTFNRGGRGVCTLVLCSLATTPL